MPAIVPRAALAAAVTAVLGLVSAPSAGATVVHCGDTITHSVVVTADVVCPAGFGNGFSNTTAVTVNGNGITVDFGSHAVTFTLSGAPAEDTARGIVVNGTGTTVKNATLTNFSFGGAVVNGNSDTLSHLNVMGSFNDRFGYVNGIVVNGSHDVLNADRTSDWRDGVLLEGVSNIVAYHADTVCDYPFDDPSVTYPEAAVRVDGDSNTVRDSTLTGCAGLLIGGAGHTTLARNVASVDDEGGHSSDISAGKGLGFAFDNTTGEKVYGNQASFPASGQPGDARGFSITNSSSGVFTNNRSQHEGYGFVVDGGSGNTLQNDTAGSTTTSSGGNAEGNGTGIWLTNGAANTMLLADNASSNHQIVPPGCGCGFGTGDGILIDPGVTGTVLSGNIANRDGNDGINGGAPAKYSSNTARYDGRYGIEAAPGSVDGGGNRASANVLGQCVNVACGTWCSPLGFSCHPRPRRG